MLNRSAHRRRWRSLARMAAVAAAAAVAVPATTGIASAAPAENEVLRALVFTKNTSHDSATQQRATVTTLLNELATQYGGQTVDIQTTDDAGQFNDANLANKDLVIFSQNGGVLFDAAQRTALEKYIRNGGGYFGMHYNSWSRGVVSETEANPFYLQLVGAQSNDGHPEPAGGQSGRVYLADTTGTDPLTSGLAQSIVRQDEWYNWDVNPTQNVHVLNYVDESTYGQQAGSPQVTEGEGEQGTAHPMTWCQKIDSGRSWFSGLGHAGSAYSEPYMMELMKRGLAYTAGLLPADCSPPAKAEEGAWSGVTPWPLMPINMSLTADGKVQSFGSVGGWGTDTTPFDFSGDSSITQGGQTQIDVWDPTVPRTLENYRSGLIANTTYTDLFCSMQVQNPYTDAVMTVGGDDSLGGNAPNDAAIGTTSFTTDGGIVDAAPMNYPRWYPTGTTTADGRIVVQGGSISGGPGGAGVQTPEIYDPTKGSGWQLLTGAKSALAYGDGGNGNGPDENRWWYPRSFVAPGSGKLFTITGSEIFALDPDANGGAGAITDAQTLDGAITNQGGNGRPIGATSTAVMYRPGKILQVGGGAFANGGGADGARAGFTVDITGGTDHPVVTATAPMKYQRHWASSTVMPDGNVIITGGSRDNANDGGFVTNAEIWNPDTGEWKTVVNPSAHPRLYHSNALLLPDGRVMIGGGGAPGPHNYTDVEYYTPSYLFGADGKPATRPAITAAPKKVGYNGTFGIQADSAISRVTLVRNGTATHSFNNGQNFQDLEFTQSGGNVSITAPEDGTYAPPGSYMLFAFDEAGVPSVAKIVKIDPAVKMVQNAPKVVDQFEYPKLPVTWRSGGYDNTVTVAAGADRLSPWKVDGQVQLVRGLVAGNGGQGLTGYQLALPAAGNISRTLRGLQPGGKYRVSLRYARDSRTNGTADGTGTISVGDLAETLTASTGVPSNGSSQNQPYATYVGEFTAGARQQTLTLAGVADSAGLMIDDLVVVQDGTPLDDAAVKYEFEEGTGTTVANTGTDDSVGSAVLTGTTGFSGADEGVFGRALDLKGGNNGNAVDLPDNLLQNAENFTTSFWVKPDTKANWIGMFHIGDGLEGAGSFFQIQMQTQAAGNTGLAATFKAKGSDLQERIYATPTKDVDVNKWNHVVFTREGATGTLYLNGVAIKTVNNLTIDMTDIGPTSNNWLGRNGFPDPAYDGKMDDVRLYTEALSAQDVATLYGDGSSLRTTTAVSVDWPENTGPESANSDKEFTVKATVKDANNAAAQGTAELWVDDAQVGSAVAVGTDGAVSFPGMALKRGDHDIEVRFVPVDGYRQSTGSTALTVLRANVGAGTAVQYTFDEKTGTAALNTGVDTSVGSATVAEGWRTNAGKFGRGITLAQGRSITLPNDITDGFEDEISVSLWANPTSNAVWRPLLNIGNGQSTYLLFQTHNGDNAYTKHGFTATLQSTTGTKRLPLTETLPLNTWTNVVFTLAATDDPDVMTGKIYFNGVLMGTESFPVSIDDLLVDGHTTLNRIGADGYNDGNFVGGIDQFEMFGYALTQSQIDALVVGPEPSKVPVAEGERYTATAGQKLTVAARGLLANDSDADTAAADLRVDVTGAPSHGTLKVEDDGSFTYQPADGFTGADTFTYKVTDGDNSSEQVTTTIAVAPAVRAVTTPQVEYALDDALGATTAKNTGWDNSAASATYGGTAGPITDATKPGGAGLVGNFPGGNSATNNHLVLPADLDQDATDKFTVSVWANPAAFNGNFVPLLQLGTGTDSYFLLQSNVNASQGGRTNGFAATFKNAAGNEQRLVLGAANDLPLNKWTLVTFTMEPNPANPGTFTGTVYYDGVQKAQRTDFPFGLASVGATGHTTANYLGGTSWPDGRFNGKMSDFRFYPYALSAASVAALYAGEDSTDKADTSVSATSEPFVAGTEGTATVTVTPADATGDVRVSADGFTFGTATLGSNGKATVSLGSDFLPGTHTLTVTYLGDDTHSGSTSTFEVTVTKVATTVSGTAPAFTVGSAGTATITATGVTTGTVTVSEGATVLGTGVLAGGKATVSLGTSLAVGVHTLKVAFAGDDTHQASVGEFSVTVKKAPAPPVPPKVGQPGNPAPVAGAVVPSKIKSSAKKLSISFSAIGAAGSVVNGKVKVYDGKKLIGTATVVHGKVTVKLKKKLKKGKHKLKFVLSASATSKAKTITKTVRVK